MTNHQQHGDEKITADSAWRQAAVFIDSLSQYSQCRFYMAPEFWLVSSLVLSHFSAMR